MEVIPYVLRFLLLAQHYHHLCGISNEINSLLLLTSQPMFKYKTKILSVTLDLVWQHDNADDYDSQTFFSFVVKTERKTRRLCCGCWFVRFPKPDRPAPSDGRKKLLKIGGKHVDDFAAPVLQL